VATLPDTPTIAETLVPGFDLSLWLGFGAPAGTPTGIINRLNREIVAVLNEPTARESFAQYGVDIASSSPEEFRLRIKNDIKAYREVASQANVHFQ